MEDRNDQFLRWRKRAFLLTFFGSMVVFPLSVYIQGKARGYKFNGYYSIDYAALGISASLLSLLSIPLMVGTHTGFRVILFELIWLFILWALWLATALASVMFRWHGGCNPGYSSSTASVIVYYRNWSRACKATQPIKGFSFFVWIILSAYLFTFFTLVCRQRLRGHKGIWREWTKDTDYYAPPPPQPRPRPQPQLIPAKPIIPPSPVPSPPPAPRPIPERPQPHTPAPVPMPMPMPMPAPAPPFPMPMPTPQFIIDPIGVVIVHAPTRTDDSEIVVEAADPILDPRRLEEGSDSLTTQRT